MYENNRPTILDYSVSYFRNDVLTYSIKLMGHKELRSILVFGWLLSTMETNCESLEISQTDRGV